MKQYYLDNQDLSRKRGRIAEQMMDNEDIYDDYERVPPTSKLLAVSPSAHKEVGSSASATVLTNHPSYTVVDNTSHYNFGSMIVLLYGHVTEGIAIPSIFDRQKQSLVTNNLEFNF